MVLTKSFIILDGVSQDTEKRLWENGVGDWDSFLSKRFIPGFSDYRKNYCDSELIKAKKNLEAKNHEFFSYKLPNSEHWRCFPHFKDESVFLDIETTGLSAVRNRVTTVSLWDGKEVKSFINGFDLNGENLLNELEKYKMIVTFNGTTFDLPFLFHHYPKCKGNHLHMDLRWLCKRVGLSGGLKRIEREVGIDRGELSDIDGAMAVRLWKRWENRGDKEALELLVRYNQEDVINLEKLAEHVLYSRNLLQ